MDARATSLSVGESLILGRKIFFQALAKNHRAELPVLPDELWALVAAVPILIGRADFEPALGYKISAKTLKNLDSLGDGPRLRCVDERNGRISYPAPWAVEWVWKRGGFNFVSVKVV